MENHLINNGNNNNNFQNITNSTINLTTVYTKPKLPKELTNRVPKLNLNQVIGRQAEIKELHTLLFENKDVVLVNGLGGIGKTTLSQAYLTRYAEEYQHLAWVSLSGTSIESDFINAISLEKAFGIKKEGKETKDIFNQLLYDLKAIEAKPNLLILDNADASLYQFKDMLPSQPNWHILVTSRENIEGFYTNELGFLSAKDALLLFQTHCTRIKDIEGIEKLLQTIDYHTLTIEILAKTAQLQRLDIAQLQNAIEKDIRANVHISHHGNKIDKVYSYLSSIFDLGKLSEMEEWLMKQMSCLPADFHHYDLIKELCCPESSGQEELLSETLESLTSKGWLLNNDDSYKIHIIVSEVTRKKLNIVIEDVVDLVENITTKLSIDASKDNPVDKFQWITFGITLDTLFGDETVEIIADIQNNLGLVLKESGNYKLAKTLLEKTIKSDIKNFGTEHPRTANKYSNLGIILQNLGDYIGAKTLFSKALILCEKNFGIEHPATLIICSNLGLVLQVLGDYDRAKELLEKALISDIKNFGTEHPNTAIKYSNLGILLQALGDYDRAKELLEKALNVDIKNFGTEHPSTTRSYSNLATLFLALGKYGEAKTLSEKAMMLNEKYLGPEHPNTAITYSNLGNILHALGEYPGAKVLLEKAMISNEKNLGPEHPNTSIAYSNLGNVLRALGDNDGAKTLLEKAMISDENNFGPDHFNTATTYSNLGLVLQALGDYVGAKSLLEKALISCEKNLGSEHQHTATAYTNLGSVLQQLENYEGAKVLFEKAIILGEKKFGSEHLNNAIKNSNLATVLYILGDYNRAKTLCKKAYLIYQNHLGEEHPTTKQVKRNLDFIIQEKG
ncbi:MULTISPECIES: tetratricopeptide repeat protein [unclassified Arcicella]|uniref:tetratricopeptide repeat protein n=1 Tax=unclassified Arcicella TaxID=2644986 RepID=UPI002863F99D|nr:MULTISPECIES: tetratricopeptide repeat protein [unclassified Arcicella]MDR6565025.1 tetratricopeptide (TPR) repeat protein [Arcicella sp. BE51]MDR6814838.1 tetratricopeptide (TPR) repeat protein [Arcicella sp. BE140]MDR6826274.1 tetratricopeptide (TPR) repeat protein [Arcicella sp. BE139]